MTWMALTQVAEPELTAQLERIMWAQLVMAGVMVVAVLVVIAVGVAALLLVRTAMARIEETKDQLVPHVTPVLSRASSIADDVGHIAAGLRGDADRIHDAVHDITDRTRAAVDGLDERVRRLAAVLDAVQTEAEILLLDATAAARGVHTTARALRKESSERSRMGRRRPDDSTGREP